MKPVIIISVLLINASLAHADLNQDCTQFWTEIRHANDQFEEHKNLKSGEKLLALLPSEKVHPPADCAKKPETLEALYRDHAFRNKLMNSGKDLGFKLTLRMMHSADGAFSEALDFELAN